MNITASQIKAAKIARQRRANFWRTRPLSKSDWRLLDKAHLAVGKEISIKGVIRLSFTGFERRDGQICSNFTAQNKRGRLEELQVGQMGLEFHSSTSVYHISVRKVANVCAVRVFKAPISGLLDDGCGPVALPKA